MADSNKDEKLITKVLDTIKKICVAIALPFVRFFRRLVR